MPPFQNFTKKAKEVIRRSHELAIERGQNHVNAIHLLTALVTQEDSLIVSIIEKLQIDANQFSADLLDEIDEIEGEQTDDTLPSAVQMYLTPDLAQIIERSMKVAKEMNDEVISTEHLFLALFDVENAAQSFLEDAKIERKVVVKALTDLRAEESKLETSFNKQFRNLSKFSRNLTEMASQDK